MAAQAEQSRSVLTDTCLFAWNIGCVPAEVSGIYISYFLVL